MRLSLALLVVALGCGTNGAATDAGGDRAADAPAPQPDAPADTAGTPDAAGDAPATQPDAADGPSTQPDAADAPVMQPDANADVGADTGADGVRLDAGTDAGPFTCGAALTCQADQYCVPQCCSGCFAPPDGGACPTGATTCSTTSGGAGCIYCTAASCVGTIPLGCNVGGLGDPRRLFCLCG